jgi:transcriptional regulator with XRE-family HTH domain
MEVRLSGCGDVLRYWRGVRGMSQLALANAAGVSTRHLSFVESGRSQPSRQMLLLLAQTLDMPLRERNALLRASGYAEIWGEHPLEARELQPARRAIDLLLERLQPYPAAALDAQWNVVVANAGVAKLMAWLELVPEFPLNVMRLLFGEQVRALVGNWEELAASLLQRLHREAALDPRSKTLLVEILSKKDIPEAWRRIDLSKAPEPLLTMSLTKNGRTIRLVTAIATLGTPLDVTLEELRIEVYLPADDASDAMLREL